MREARTLGSWVIALFLTAMFAWVAVDLAAPQPPGHNHLFEVFAASSGIAWFEPTGRFAVGALAALAALLIFLPPTRRLGAILGALIGAGLAALVAQLVMQGITVPVDSVEAGKLVTKETDPSALLYLILALLAASVILAVVHPGRQSGD